MSSIKKNNTKFIGVRVLFPKSYGDHIVLSIWEMSPFYRIKFEVTKIFIIVGENDNYNKLMVRGSFFSVHNLDISDYHVGELYFDEPIDMYKCLIYKVNEYENQYIYYNDDLYPELISSSCENDFWRSKTVHISSTLVSDGYLVEMLPETSEIKVLLYTIIKALMRHVPFEICIEILSTGIYKKIPDYWIKYLEYCRGRIVTLNESEISEDIKIIQKPKNCRQNSCKNNCMQKM